LGGAARGETGRPAYLPPINSASLSSEAEAAAAFRNEPAEPMLDPTEEDDATDEMSRIETRLEHLAEIAERCRKIIMASKIAIGGGVALLLVTILGLLGLNENAAIGSIAVMLGGIVSLGSNISTLRQTMAAIDDAERLRTDMIDRKHLRLVVDNHASSFN
jgi:hypothetical protein